MFNSGFRGKRASDNTGTVDKQSQFVQQKYPQPSITGYSIQGSDDTALNPAGGQTVLVNGTGFASGAAVTVNGVTISPVTVISPTQLSFTSTALAGGSYTLIVYNSTGGAAILVPGLVYSSVPTYTTPAGSIGTSYETRPINTSVVATSDSPITYSLASGSLPSGATLYANGVITGTSPIESGSTTYTFAIKAEDAELQDVTRTFTLTVNTDVVTWSSPASGAVISTYEYLPIANTTLTATSAAGYGVQYSGTNLPTGINISGNLLVGTANTVANTNITLTATANTTNRTANRTAYINVQQDAVTWNSPADNTTYTVAANTAISNVSLNATSAAGFGVVYAANTLPTGLTLSGNIIAGTPTAVANTSSLLTATANTSNRTATRTINWVVQLGNDPYFNLTTLLLSGETTSPYWIQDASTNGFALTVNGDTRPVALSPYNVSWSNYFDGNGDYLSTPANTAFSFGTGDFTIECWINTSVGGLAPGPGYSRSIMSMGDLVFYLRVSQYHGGTNGALRVSGLTPIDGSTVTLTDGFWHHIAVVRQSSVVRYWIDGVYQTEASGSTVTTNFTNNNLNVIGAQSNPVEGWFNGYISNVRVVKGTAVYIGTANFVPSTSPLTAVSGTSLLTCQSNRFIDNSTNSFTISVFGNTFISNYGGVTETDLTTGSGYFDGSTDYITQTTNSSYGFGTGDFTIEFWLYLNSTGLQTIYSNLASASSTNPHIYISSTIRYFTASADRITGSSLSTSIWYHIAVARASGSTKLFINGTQSGSTYTDGNNYGATAPLGIGTYWEGGSPYTSSTLFGYINNLRVVKGTAVYTSNFTPPASPLTAVANTSLLTLQNRFGENNNRFVDTSGINNIITRNGNPTQGTFSPFSQTGWSNYFDGNSDYISTTLPTAIGTSNFTFEAWVYRAAQASNDSIFTIGGTGNLYVQFYLTYFRCWVGGLSSSFLEYDGVVNNTWYHVACTRSGSTVRLFLNGTLRASGSTSQNLTDTTTRIGALDLSAGTWWTGYISNLRLVIGTALYTATFTPSTTPLAPVTNTALLTCQTYRIIDNSGNRLTLTRNGDVSTHSFGPFGPSITTPVSYSGYFDGNDSLTYTHGSELAFGTGDFTIEYWLYANSAVHQGILQGDINVGWGLFVLSGTLYWQSVVNQVNRLTASVAAYLTAIWRHWALVRSSGTLSLYIDGQLITSVADSTNYSDASGTFYIGQAPVLAIYINGYLSNLRIVKGTAVYTSNFTPPTSPLTAIANTSLLTCQSSTFIDNSANYFTITASGNTIPSEFNPFGITSATGGSATYSVATIGGSSYFDGTGDYLTVLDNVGFHFTGNFTIEAWVYRSSTAYGCIAAQWVANSPSDTSWIFSVNANGTIYFAYNISGAVGTSGTTAIATPFQWNHVAVTRLGTTLRFFVNGVVDASTFTVSGSFVNSAGAVTVGIVNTSDGGAFNGFIHGPRIVQGKALYTTSFSPSTTPLQSINATSLLVTGTNAGIFDYTSRMSLETVGSSTQLSTLVKKFGNSSMSFNGSTTSLTSSATITSPQLSFGAGNFTIEGWFYFNSVASRAAIINQGWGETGYNTQGGFTFDIAGNTGGALSLAVGTENSGAFWLQSMGSFTTGVWYHIALVRNGVNISVYSNGTSIGSGNLSGGASTLVGNMGRITIGSYQNGGFPFNGYVDDFRITKGYARYTGNFTAPTSAFSLF